MSRLANQVRVPALSQTTVSRALNGYPEVSEETRRRLGDEFPAEEEMGCVPLKNVAEPVRAYRLRAGERESAVAQALVERRRHQRRRVSWPIRVWIGDESFDGHAVDSSIYGIRLAIVAKDLLKVGESYRVEIFIDENKPLQYTAEVRNLSDHGVGMETKEPFPLG